MAKLGTLQMGLVGEQEIVHLPKLPLPRNGLSRKCGVQGMRVNSLQREVPEGDSDAPGETL